jgi:hypothetical protein
MNDTGGSTDDYNGEKIHGRFQTLGGGRNLATIANSIAWLLKFTNGAYSANVPSHGVLLLRVSAK